MSFPAYPSYRESGVDWLGEVPSHWTVTALKRAFAISGGSTPKSDVEDFWDGEIPWITPGDLSKLGTKFLTGTARMITESGLASCATSLSPAGSVVISTRAPIGSLAVTKIPASTNQGCKTLIPANGVNAVFAFYTLSSATEQLNVRGKGSTFLEISADDLGAFALPFPPSAEQDAIAAFLDRETAKIDALIEEQQRLIALLKEKRQAVISHAVTKGLDPNAPMKDSGIEWLGEVPAHWAVRPLRYLISLRSGGTPSKAREDFWDGSIPWASAKDLKSERLSDTIDHLTELAISEGSVELNPAGSILILVRGMMLARAFPVVEILVPMAINQDLKAVLPKIGMSSHFLAWAFRGTAQESLDRCAEAGHGTKALRMEDWLSLPLPCPPLDEQVALANLLDDKTQQINELVATAEAAIGLLAERRAALISAAVTGKIDVRGTAKVLPFPVDRTRARSLVATEIIERCASQPTFGRVKFQKIAFLAEGHVGISELEGSYLREAAGPLDRLLIEEMENGAQAIAGVERDQPGGPGTTVTYRLGRSRGAHRQELADWLGEERTTKLDKLIADFADLTTKGAEAVATLYGVWNDALIDGQSPSDDEIIAGFLNDWHSEKPKKFRAAELPTWLDWMRRHGIVPTGSGPKATTGRLFA
ncbi:restriction endonuclease subunit S [Novosphingobium sp. BL-8H]|uniref:restriction endonuclease subunit S n=1 Tax=Novosphingobium sp. BL-8H TaxID=3127640 RepID=UPI003756A2DF